MKHLNIFMLILLLGLVSCSSGEKGEGGDEASENETAMESGDEGDDDMFAEDEGEEEGGDDVSEDEDMLFGDEGGGSSSPSIEMSGDEGMYTVESGDTLMLIAFKLYGDYSQWQSLQSMNPNVSSGSLTAGTTIKYNKPSTPFTWSPTGEPHLIRKGETLGTISNDKYGTPSKWRSIYQNNQPMIKDPNLIFAGFTLYYVADDRSIASDEI